MSFMLIADIHKTLYPVLKKKKKKKPNGIRRKHFLILTNSLLMGNSTEEKKPKTFPTMEYHEELCLHVIP